MFGLCIVFMHQKCAFFYWFLHSLSFVSFWHEQKAGSRKEISLTQVDGKVKAFSYVYTDRPVCLCRFNLQVEQWASERASADVPRGVSCLTCPSVRPSPPPPTLTVLWQASPARCHLWCTVGEVYTCGGDWRILREECVFFAKQIGPVRNYSGGPGAGKDWGISPRSLTLKWGFGLL